MKRRSLFLVLAALACVLTLFSCTEPENEDFTEVENLIYGPGTSVTIIANDKAEHIDLINFMQREIFNVTGETPKVKDDSAEAGKHEVVIGETSRPISQEAYRLLSRMEKESDSETAYLIYSDGSSIAIAYEKDRYGINITADKAKGVMAYLGRKNTYVAAARGVVSGEVFDALAYQEEIDAEEQAKAWENFERELNEMGADGKAIADAVKLYYDRVCTKDIISWMANLYDPVTGGFYFSNGARNTEGFLPDAESTAQALGIFEKFGLNVGLKESVPDWMQKQIIAFLKKLQDPVTGYFYHPQWSKAEVNAHRNRLNRDLTKSVATLKSFGALPTYNAPNGAKGDGILWNGEPVSSGTKPASSYITGSLFGRSTVSAVSAVMPVSTAPVPDNLVSTETFRDYLDELDRQHEEDGRSFYAIGNEVGTQTEAIIERDKTLGNPESSNLNEKYPLGTMLCEWYTNHQNKETGLWDEGVNYDATNALLKICGTFGSFERLFPNVNLAVESCVQMILSKDEALTVCYVYNIWMSLDKLFDNINTYGSDADKEYAREVRLRLLEMAPEAIRVSAEKQLQFKKKDGSFSFEEGANCLTSQGLRVGIPGSEDGDVNSTVISTGGTILNCLAALGISDIAPSYYTKSDYYRFIAMLEDLGPIIKDSTDIPIDYATFDEETTGQVPTSVDATVQKGTIQVVDRPGGNYGDKAVRVITDSDKSSDNIKVLCQTGSLTSSCFVFESDIMIESAENITQDGITVMQVLMQPAVYMINITVDRDGTVRLVESSSTSWSTAKQDDLPVTATLGEWFNLKIEYYLGDHDTVRIKVYYNEKLIAITDNYFDRSGAKLNGVGTPADSMDYTNFVAQSTVGATYYIDNVACYKTATAYKAPSSRDPLPPICIDPPETDEKIYDFEESVIPEDFTVSVNNGAVSYQTVGENGVLHISGAKINDSKVDKPTVLRSPLNIRTGVARCTVFEADISVSDAVTGSVLQVSFSQNPDGTKVAVCFEVEIYEQNGEKWARIVDAPDGVAASAVARTDIKLVDGAFKLRLEYFEREHATLIYVNDVSAQIKGKCDAMSDSICKNGDKYTPRYVTITGAKKVGCDVMIDNLLIEKNVINFSKEADPGVPRVDYPLTSPDIAVTVNGATYNKDGLGLELSSGNHSLKIPVSKRGDIITATSLSVTMELVSEGAAAYTVVLADTYGNEIMCFDLVVTASEVEIYERNVKGRAELIGSYELDKKKFTLSLDYFHKSNVLNVMIDGKPVGATLMTYLYDRDSLIPEIVSIKQTVANGLTMRLTNLYAENSIVLYKAVALADKTAPSVTLPTTFENASYGALPNNLTVTLRSYGAKAAVKALMKDGEATRMFYLYTANGGNDSVSFAIDETNAEGATATVMETMLMLDLKADIKDPSIQFFFRSEGDTEAWRINVYFNKGKAMTASDWYKSGGTYSGEWPVITGALFKLRIEYTVIDGVMKVNMFVNGEYVGSSTRMVLDEPMAVQDVKRVILYTGNSTTAGVLVDDFSFYYTDTPTEIPETEDPPGDNEGGDGNEGGSGGNEGGNTEGGDNTGGSGDNTEGGDDTAGGSTEEGNPGSFDNVGAIPTVPDNAPEHDVDGWT